MTLSVRAPGIYAEGHSGLGGSLMSASEASRGWNPESAYTEALAVVHAVLEVALSDESFQDDGVPVDTGRHGVVDESRRSLKGFSAQTAPRGDHAQRAIPEPLVNGTTASDLFLLLQRHGDLAIAVSTDEHPVPSAQEEQPNDTPPEVPSVHTADPADVDAQPRIPGRRTGFIPLPESQTAPETRSERMRLLIAQWHDARATRLERSRGRRA